jgi:hypothetical protein
MQVIACHMLSIEMSWGATSKEAENKTFFEEVPKIFAEVQIRVCASLCNDCGDGSVEESGTHWRGWCRMTGRSRRLLRFRPLGAVVAFPFFVAARV